MVYRVIHVSFADELLYSIRIYSSYCMGWQITHSHEARVGKRHIDSPEICGHGQAEGADANEAG